MDNCARISETKSKLKTLAKRHFDSDILRKLVACFGTNMLISSKPILNLLSGNFPADRPMPKSISSNVVEIKMLIGIIDIRKILTDNNIPFTIYNDSFTNKNHCIVWSISGAKKRSFEGDIPSARKVAARCDDDIPVRARSQTHSQTRSVVDLTEPAYNVRLAYHLFPISTYTTSTCKKTLSWYLSSRLLNIDALFMSPETFEVFDANTYNYAFETARGEMSAMHFRNDSERNKAVRMRAESHIKKLFTNDHEVSTDALKCLMNADSATAASESLNTTMILPASCDVFHITIHEERIICMNAASAAIEGFVDKTINIYTITVESVLSALAARAEFEMTFPKRLVMEIIRANLTLSLEDHIWNINSIVNTKYGLDTINFMINYELFQQQPAMKIDATRLIQINSFMNIFNVETSNIVLVQYFNLAALLHNTVIGVMSLPRGDIRHEITRLIEISKEISTLRDVQKHKYYGLAKNMLQSAILLSTLNGSRKLELLEGMRLCPTTTSLRPDRIIRAEALAVTPLTPLPLAQSVQTPAVVTRSTQSDTLSVQDAALALLSIDSVESPDQMTELSITRETISNNGFLPDQTEIIFNELVKVWIAGGKPPRHATQMTLLTAVITDFMKDNNISIHTLFTQRMQRMQRMQLRTPR